MHRKKHVHFIAVGGGTAGSALAARLAEVSDWKILLLEAGGEQPSKVKIPWFHLWLPNTPLDWKYVTEPQPDAMWAFEKQVGLTKSFEFLNSNEKPALKALLF